MSGHRAARGRSFWGGAALLALAITACGVEEPPPAPPPSGGAAGADDASAPAVAAPALRVDQAAAGRAALARLGDSGVHGRLMDADGEPAVGARVYLLAAAAPGEAAPAEAGQEPAGAPLAEASVVEEGVFALPSELGGVTKLVVWAVFPGHADWRAEVAAGAGWLDIGVRQLERGRVILGRVGISGTGAAPPDAVVRVETDEASRSDGLLRVPGRERGIWARANADGRFELGPVPEAGVVTISAVAPGFRRALRRDLELSGLNREVLLELQVGTALRGVVHTGTGDPVAGARIEAWPQDSELPPLVAISDARGAFVADGLQPHRLHRVEVRAPGMRLVTRPNVVGGDEEMELVMQPASVVHVGVRGLPLRAGSKVQLALRRADAPAYAKIASRDVAVAPDRPLTVLAPVAGEMIVTLFAEGEALAASAPFRVDTEVASLRVEVERVAAGVVSGQLLTRSGAPRADGQVLLTPAGESLPAAIQGTVRAESDREGRFRVSGLVPGRYRVAAQHAQACRAVREDLEVGIGAEVVMAPMTLAAGAAVMGTLGVDLGAGDVAWVTATPEAAPEPVVFGEVAPSGSFALAEALPAGSFTLRGYVQDRARTGKPRLVVMESFEVRAGQRALELHPQRR